jgi:cobalt/nickel transport protein
MIDNRMLMIGGLIIALLIGVVAVFMASGDPDGLESSALVIQGDKTLTGDTPQDAEVNEDLSNTFSYESPMPDYSLGEEMGSLGGIIAIIGGTLLIFIVALGITHGVKQVAKSSQ